MSLWAFVCSVLLCYLWEKEHLRNSLGRFFSHRAHRVHWAFLRTVSSPQNASGIQRTQSVSAIVDTDKGQQAAYILFIGVSRWSLPFPSGEGSGEGPLSFWHLSSFVIMSLCLKRTTCLSPSLCYSVLKTTPSVTPVLLLLCLKELPCPSVLMLLCLQRLSCLPSCRVFSCLKMNMFVFFINYLLFRCILSFFY